MVYRNTQIQRNFFIMTGSPGSGKSTILRELKNIAVTVIDEPARQILAEQRSFGGNGVPENDPVLFTELMLSRAIYQFKRLQDKNVPVLFDRGIPDTVGYASLFGIDQGSSKNASGVYRYNKTVFITPPWKEIYSTDDERKMSFDQASKFGDELRRIYIDFEYEIIEIPIGLPRDRAKFVHNRLISA
jgi:predicted ATPase